MKQPLWIDEVYESLEELGGKASLQDIYGKVQSRGNINLEDKPTWKNTIRRTLENYSSDSKAYLDKGDLFKNPQKGKGIWEIRE